MNNVLQRLGATPVPARLSQIDDSVLCELAERQREARATSRLFSVATVFALGIGYAGGNILPTQARAADDNLVISETDLAPSNLLNFL